MFGETANYQFDAAPMFDLPPCVGVLSGPREALPMFGDNAFKTHLAGEFKERLPLPFDMLAEFDAGQLGKHLRQERLSRLQRQSAQIITIEVQQIENVIGELTA